MTAELTAEYANKIRPLLASAKRAYGARNQDTPAHQASRQYTQLLVEFDKKGGSITALCAALGVSYAGVRRRIYTYDLPVSNYKQYLNPDADVDKHIESITAAKTSGSVDEYYRTLYEAYVDGVALSEIASRLELTNPYPLYYGVQKHTKKLLVKPNSRD